MSAEAGDRGRWLIVLGLAVWVGLALVGFKMIMDYKSRPGSEGTAPAAWPVASRFAPSTGKSTLVMFVHPRCACTRASLYELNAIMDRAGGKAAGYVVFILPSGVGREWIHTDTWASAARIAGMTAVADPDGREAARFGAETSGQVVLYDAGGRLQFAGGITDSRGHIGDNMGQRTLGERIASPVTSPAVSPSRHAVFGCPMGDQEPASDPVARGRS
jgi:hypothetical protein